jgi:hypothetical protein
MKSLHTGVALCLAALCLSGCYTTTLRSGLPPAAAKIDYDKRWHHGVIWGIAELSGPYDLSQVCPKGWAEVTTETSFVTGLLSFITYSLYAPQTVTVRCAAGADDESDSDSSEEGGESSGSE